MNVITHVGMSMHPWLTDGDQIEVSFDVPLDQIELGDIVVSRVEGQLVAHRLIEKNHEGLILKGDSNRAADPIVRRPLGYVQGVYRKGNFIDFAKMPIYVKRKLASLSVRTINKEGFSWRRVIARSQLRFLAELSLRSRFLLWRKKR